MRQNLKKDGGITLAQRTETIYKTIDEDMILALKGAASAKNWLHMINSGAVPVMKKATH